MNIKCPYFAKATFIFVHLKGFSIAQSMKIKSFLARPFASYIYKGIRKGMASAVSDQENILKNLLKVGRITEIGKEAGLDKVNSYEEYRRVSLSILPKPPAPPVALSTFQLPKILFPTILIRPEMHCYVIWPKREIRSLRMAN